MEKTWFVYVHQNLKNGKRYVGITSRKDPAKRWCEGRGYSRCPRFYSAIKKYGWDDFSHVIILSGVDYETALNAERNLIYIWQTQDARFGYNLTSGGEGTPDYHPSAATLEKLSCARRKENLSAETLRRRSEGLRGRKFSDEHKRKIGDGNSKRINMYEKSGVFIKSFRGAHDAENEFGISHTHISQCCHGRRNSAGGYLWRFAQ